MPLSVSTYDAMLTTISDAYEASEEQEKRLSLRALARMAWIADYAMLDGNGVQVRIYDDHDVLQVVEMLRGGDGWCRMVIGL